MKKVAIIGAGLSGLACAYELERNGISPTIFEKKNYIGEELIASSAVLRLFNPTVETAMKYLRKNFDISITPFSKLNKITMIGPTKDVTIEANLGYIFKRGGDEESLESQLKQYINSEVSLNTYAYYNDVKEYYDSIVVATGEFSIAKELGIWNQNYTSFVKIAKVLGDFETDYIKMWMNTKYCKSGYAFLIPNNSKQANIILVVSNISYHELSHYWTEFLKTEEIKYTIIETRDYEASSGSVYPVQIGNTYLVGNAGGFLDDLLGFGQVKAIESGVLAARAIVKDKDYNKMMKSKMKEVKKLHEFRKAVNDFQNDDFDRLISFIKCSGIKYLLYDNPVFKLRHAAFIAKLYNKFGSV